MQIQSPMDGVELSRIRAIGEEVQRLRGEGRDVISLQIGEPDFCTPAFIMDAAGAAMGQGRTHYAPNRGLLSLREEISKKLAGENGIAAPAETEVLVTSGCAEALFAAFLGLVEPGDEVIIIEPAYISYLQLARIARATPVFVPAREENGWLPDPEDIRRAVSAKTKLLVLNSPCNPTGAVYPRALLQEIARIAVERDFLVLSDEVYEKLVYDGAEHVSIASLEGMRERTVTVNGFSKAFAMTGWRMGYLAAVPELLLPMLKVHQYAVGSSNIIAQCASAAALQGDGESVEEMRREYARRRRFLLDALGEIPGISCAEPHGTFYLYPNVSKTGMTGGEFAARLLREGCVAAVPGSAFESDPNSAHIRVSYASSLENLEEAVRRLRKLLNA